MIDENINTLKKSFNISVQMDLIRRRFLQSISMVLLILAVIGLPLSLSRLFQTDLNLNHLSHLFISLLVVILFVSRKKLSNRNLLISILLIFSLLSLASFLQYGIVSAGFYFSAVCIFVSGMALGLRGGVLFAVLYSVIISVIAYLWMTGILTFPGDVGKYILLPSVWVLLAVSFIITTTVFFVSATSFFSSLKELAGKINKQKTEIEEQAAELSKTNKDLEEALSNVKILSGLLPICAKCKDIRDDKGYWNQIELFLKDHSEIVFSHGLCPKCAEEMYGDRGWFDKEKEKV